jgi:catechol 2,3-dioxygenase-like lactoylglutathione lyase family enzyme
MRAVLDHIVLNVTDLDAALAFYRDVLGLPVEMVDEYRRGERPFPCVRLNDDTVVDLFPPHMWRPREGPAQEPRQRRLNHFCLVLRGGDWDRLLARLSDLGVHVDGPPAKVLGARGLGASVYIADPDGNRIELKTYDDGDRTIGET